MGLVYDSGIGRGGRERMCGMGMCCGGKKSGAMIAVFAGVYVAVFVPMMAGWNEDPDADVVVAGDVQVEKEIDMGTDVVSNDVLGYEIEMIDGSKKSLEDYRGQVVMMVNVASECGLTPQYEGLEALYKAHKDDGLVVIGFPANEFGGQEPGTNEEIAQFCSTKFAVSFPMAAKIVVKGKGIHPLYKQLTLQAEPIGGEIEWNFDKFLVNRAGEVVGRFKPRTTPEDAELVAAVDGLLAEK